MDDIENIDDHVKAATKHIGGNVMGCAYRRCDGSK